MRSQKSAVTPGSETESNREWTADERCGAHADAGKNRVARRRRTPRTQIQSNEAIGGTARLPPGNRARRLFRGSHCAPGRRQTADLWCDTTEKRHGTCKDRCQRWANRGLLPSAFEDACRSSVSMELSANRSVIMLSLITTCCECDG